MCLLCFWASNIVFDHYPGSVGYFFLFIAETARLAGNDTT